MFCRVAEHYFLTSKYKVSIMLFEKNNVDLPPLTFNHEKNNRIITAEASGLEGGVGRRFRESEPLCAYRGAAYGQH